MKNAKQYLDKFDFDTRVDEMAMFKLRRVIFDVLFTEYLEFDDATRATGDIIKALEPATKDVMKTAKKMWNEAK